jgi:hypothetical protein
MKYIIPKLLLPILLCCVFSNKTVGQPFSNEYYSERVVDSLFYAAARCYYAEDLKNYDVRDLRASAKGFRSVSFGGKSHYCYRVEVVYSIYKDCKWNSTHYIGWYWDLGEKKCYWYSTESVAHKPGEPDLGMLTSAAYIDATTESFAQRGFEILKKLSHE